jgi:tRNA-modifying protein YgfZ
MTGYDSLRSSAAWLDLSGRGKIRMTGEDRVRLLHAMSTNDIQKLESGRGCYAFFLNAQGRILADAHVYNLGESLLLDTEPETTQKLMEHLDKYIIADDATLTDETAQLAAIGIEGPESEAAMAALGAPVPGEAESTAVWQGGFVAAVSATGATGFRLFVPAEQKSDVIARLSAIVEADAEAANAVRLEHGKPRYGDDITERFLVQETNQMQAVSFTKGCYLGQEIVERVRSRAQIHRVLTPLRIHSPLPPAPRTKLSVDGKDVAEITSAAFSPAFDEVAALGYVRVEELQNKAEMVVTGSEPPVRAAFAPEAPAPARQT